MVYKIYQNRKISSVSYFYSTIKYGFLFIYIGVSLILLILLLISSLDPTFSVLSNLDPSTFFLTFLSLFVIAIPISLTITILTLPFSFIFGMILNNLNIALIGAKFLTAPFYKIFSGRLGSILSKVYLFDLDGDTFCDEGFISEFHSLSERELFQELNFNRGRDIFLFPVFISAFFATYLFNIIYSSITAIQFGEDYISYLKLILIFIIPFFLGLLPILVHSLLASPLLMLDEGGIKLVKFGEGGNIKSINGFGSIIRGGLDKIFGISALLSFIQVITSFNDLPYLTNSSNIQTWQALLLILPFLLVLGGMLLPVSNLGILPIFKNYESIIGDLRRNLKKLNIETVGSISSNFRMSETAETKIEVIEGTTNKKSLFKSLLKRTKND